MLGHLALARRVLYYYARMWLSQFVEQNVANGAEMSAWRRAERLVASWRITLVSAKGYILP